ncbi:DUF1275 domain-containing protein [Kribbella sp. NBC_00382]|uniref:YoaK family protein n=1 Tax=Kribbella sp. NBC_00382 TaxID=2975967 RepID=UPI002E1D36DD
MTSLRVELVPFLLSFVAGMVDVTSYVLLHGLFTAHITGNVVVLAADAAVHRPVRATVVLAVAVFIAVTAALTVVVDRSQRPPYRWAAPFLWLQFALLVAAALLAGPGVETAVALLAVAAMACQNALLHLTFRRAPSTAVMTGNIVASTVALVGLATGRSRTPATRAADRVAWTTLRPLLFGFVAGCVLGAAASEVVDRLAWLVPAVTSGLLAAGVTKSGLPVPLRREE